MKVRGIVFVLSLLLPSVAFANSFIGVWSTKEDKSRVEIKNCSADESKLCGTIIWLKEPLDENGKAKADDNNPEKSLRGRLILGLPLMTEIGRAHV